MITATIIDTGQIYDTFTQLSSLFGYDHLENHMPSGTEVQVLDISLHPSKPSSIDAIILLVRSVDSIYQTNNIAMINIDGVKFDNIMVDGVEMNIQGLFPTSKGIGIKTETGYIFDSELVMPIKQSKYPFYEHQRVYSICHGAGIVESIDLVWKLVYVKFDSKVEYSFMLDGKIHDMDVHPILYPASLGIDQILPKKIINISGY